MLIVYSPDGQEPQEYKFFLDDLKLSQQSIIEREYSRLCGERRSLVEFLQDLRTNSPNAVRVALHFCMRQIHPTTRLDDVDPKGKDVRIRHHRFELDSVRARAMKIPDPLQREEALALLDVEYADAVDDDDSEVGGGGKAPGENSSTSTTASTGGRSRKRGRTTT